ncbi:Fc receptor-like protein 2 [Hyla sarda]|uniref:Fc receptor-like protein 2 n=1 Tax=Hyla sarda TaxID=327740 RepID=UPI0024C25616|nr:Fc receptor-like protein 2 [Hyla sarda]
MQVLIIITLLSSIKENSGSSARHVVTSSPNWNHIYMGDPVTLTCDIGPDKSSNNYYFYWYKDSKEISQRKQKFTIRSANTSDSGVYECWTGSGDRSHPLTLYVIQKDVKNRPTVTFIPNYRNIFSTEKMKISCEDGSYATRNQRYVWYKNNTILKNDQKFITIIKANRNDSGEYRCGSGRRASYPLRLHVHPIYDKVILQTPPNILEGDPLDVRCHSYPHYSNKEEDGTFYKDGDIIQKSNQILHLENVTKSTTGIYRCEKKILNINTSEETFIFVQDIFTRPEIIAGSDLKEGDALTLRCDTRRNPLREDTELTFTFYRNGETVQELRSHDTYTIKSVQLEDSGKYSCEVRTPSDTVMKKSQVLYISIKELFMKPEIQSDPKKVQEGAGVTIRCLQTQNLNSSLFTFYRDSQSVQNASKKEEYVIPSASEEHTGNYKCSLTNRGISKNSSEIMVQVQLAVDKPILMLSSNNVTVGDDTVLRCESSKGSYPIHYLFYHKQTLLGNITVHQKGTAQLQLSITSLTMGGLYSCASYNDFQTQPQRSEEANLLVIDRSFPWLMLWILPLVFILLVGLFLQYRKKILSSGYCHKESPSTGSVQNIENVDRQNTTTAQEEVYGNVTPEENLEDEGCTYVTLRMEQDPSPCSSAATKEDALVVYATVKKSDAVTSETNRDQMDPDTSDSTVIFHNPIYN